MEKELLKIQKLESLGLLAGGIAHDLNNMLTGILGNISLAKTWLDPGDRIFERLNEAEKASFRATDLVLQLLTFTKGGTPVKRVVSIADLIKQSVHFALRGSSVLSQFTFKEGLWPVEIDEGQIGQVFQNLAINALQAMPDGGTLQIEAENLTMETDREKIPPFKKGDYVKVSIKDQGIGVPKDHLSRIFDPYFTTKQQGSGLGLAISASIIQKHEGCLTVESEPGRGTTFFVYLPASSKELTPPKKEEDELVFGRGRVLVMDDDETVLDMAGKMLRHLGYEADLSRSGTAALLRFRHARDTGEPYDAVLTDFTVPGDIGGLAVLRKLKEIDPRVKVILSSGYSNDPVMAHFKTFGFSGIIIKPYTITELSKTLNDIIGGSGSA